MKFDLSSIDDSSKVLFADLYVHQKESDGDPIIVEVRKVDNAWSESEKLHLRNRIQNKEAVGLI